MNKPMTWRYHFATMISRFFRADPVYREFPQIPVFLNASLTEDFWWNLVFVTTAHLADMYAKPHLNIITKCVLEPQLRKIVIIRIRWICESLMQIAWNPWEIFLHMGWKSVIKLYIIKGGISLSNASLVRLLRPTLAYKPLLIACWSDKGMQN